MLYIVNVAIGGRHYCRIILPESWNEEIAAKHKAREIAKLFGSSFEVTMTRETTSGQQINLQGENSNG